MPYLKGTNGTVGNALGRAMEEMWARGEAVRAGSDDPREAMMRLLLSRIRHRIVRRNGKDSNGGGNGNGACRSHNAGPSGSGR